MIEISPNSHLLLYFRFLQDSSKILGPHQLLLIPLHSVKDVRGRHQLSSSRTSSVASTTCVISAETDQNVPYMSGQSENIDAVFKKEREDIYSHQQTSNDNISLINKLAEDIYPRSSPMKIVFSSN